MPRNETKVRGIQMERWSKLKQQKKKKLRLGDIVRIKTSPTSKISSSARAYAEQYLPEYFIVTRISTSMPTVRYYLRSMNDNQHLLESFYINELSQIRETDLFKVEKILKTRRGRRGGEREYLVKWKHFGPHWNEWIPASNIQEIF